MKPIATTVTLPNLLLRLWHHLTRRRRRQFLLLIGLMLVSAFAGRERVLAAYEEAVRERYRFFSYGDAMFLY